MFYKKIALIALLSLIVLPLKADFIKRYSIAGGISTISIVNDNPATRRIIETDTTKPTLYGGNFGQIAPGFAIKSILELDYEGNLRIPIDLDWTMFSAGERHPVSGLWTIYYWHEVHHLSFGTGIHYAFYELEWAKAKLYGGLDVRLNYIAKAELTYRDHWTNRPDRDTTYVVESKKNTVRLGALGRLGVEGQLIGNWYVNTSVALGALNLVGRDDNRGELLTPTTIFKEKEQIVPVFNFSFMVQYKF